MEVRSDDGSPVARAESLDADGESPMARLTIEGDGVHREQIWPDELLNGAGETRNLVLPHLGVERKQELADADDEERDNCRD